MQQFLELFNLKQKPQFYLQALTTCSLLVAVGVVCELFLGITFPLFGLAKGVSVNASFAFIILAGYLYGPLWGGLVGIAQDLITVLLEAKGAPFIGFTITTFLVGFLAGCYIFFARGFAKKPLGIATYCFFAALGASLLNSFWLSAFLSNKGYWIILFPRLVSVPFGVILYTAILYVLYCVVVPRLQKSRLNH